jgi:hypothetical protein
VVYQELHQDIYTSKFGVFSLIIGHGTPTGNAPCGELSQISWESAYHFLKVEVKFENDFMDMGTMQFLAVPYALYARRSLEPGPAGPKGDPGQKGEPGDPASDDQTLSFDGSTLTIAGGNSLSLTDLLQNLTVSYQSDGTYLGISRGNSVKLATIEADGDPKNELQDITISSDKLKITNNTLATEWDLSPYRQSLLWDPATRVLSISGTSSVINLSELKNDSDADITNEIQDLQLTDDLLTITKNSSSTGVSLVKYLDNTDSQQLTFDGGILSLTNSTSVDLSPLGNDADYDVTNEIQDLQLNGDLLTITKNSESQGVSLSKYLDNTDEQQLGFNSVSNTLTLTGSESVNLTSLIDDADADPQNEIQSLSYNETDLTKSLSISGSGSVVIDNKVAFRARKNTSTSTTQLTEIPFLPDEQIYNDGSTYNATSGVFTAPVAGLYSFDINYSADGPGGSRELIVYYNTGIYEKLAIEISSGTLTSRSITMKLNSGDQVKLMIYTGMATQTGTGSFSGYKVN